MMHSLHNLHKLNAYRVDLVRLSVRPHVSTQEPVEILYQGSLQNVSGTFPFIMINIIREHFYKGLNAYWVNWKESFKIKVYLIKIINVLFCECSFSKINSL